VVDDCSSDKTVDVVMAEIKKATVSRIKLLRLKENHGKGGAVRKGVMRALGERILFADADNATDIRDLEKLDTAMSEASTDGAIVCGSRAHLETEAIAKRNPLRNVLMHGFHFIVATLCVRNVRDTQCGFKLLDRTAARLVFTPMHIERWAFDVELLFIAATHKLTVKVREGIHTLRQRLVFSLVLFLWLHSIGGRGAMARSPWLQAQCGCRLALDAARARADSLLLYLWHLEDPGRWLPLAPRRRHRTAAVKATS
jgi:glycosyltransferase involved in cell wall biosynthesis